MLVVVLHHLWQTLIGNKLIGLLLPLLIRRKAFCI
jgi:hypothetical protein